MRKPWQIIVLGMLAGCFDSSRGHYVEPGISAEELAALNARDWPSTSAWSETPIAVVVA